MELVFQKRSADEPSAPRPGQLYLTPAGRQGEGGLAARVLAHGLDAFPRGTGVVECIVLDAEPSFDALLAAAFVTRLLSGRSLPAGCRAFARYAEVGRQGRKPTDFPFEESLEGVYLGCRLLAGEDLTDPAVALRFTAHWSRLAMHIFRAAANDVDPFTSPLFADEAPELAPVRERLAQDRDLYREDVARGERWLVGARGPARGAALYLRQPKSRLFQHWSRSDSDTPTGRPYVFLAAHCKQGQLLCCADPGLNVSFRPLAEKLGCAEPARPEYTDRTPPEERNGLGCVVMTPVAGPPANDRVLAAVKAWLGAAPGRGPWKVLTRVALALVALLACAAVGWVAWSGLGLGGERGGLASRGLVFDEDPPNTAAAPGNLYVLTVGVSKYEDAKYNLACARGDAEDLAQAFAAQKGKLFKDVHTEVMTDDRATRGNILEALSALSKKATRDDFLVVTLSGHGANFGDVDHFYFLPHDFDETKKISTGVLWEQLYVCLEDAPCRVFVVMDTCHSGTITLGWHGAGDPQSELRREIPSQADKGGRGIILMAACLSGGQAMENSEWRHGALTLALLEALNGQRLYTEKAKTPLPNLDERGEISIKELDYYAAERVKELAGGRQAVFTQGPGDLPLDQVPIARRE